MKVSMEVPMGVPMEVPMGAPIELSNEGLKLASERNVH